MSWESTKRSCTHLKRPSNRCAKQVRACVICCDVIMRSCCHVVMLLLLGIAKESSLSSSDLTSISKRLTALEMKELNERQRADHAARMYNQQKKQLRDLEDRCACPSSVKTFPERFGFLCCVFFAGISSWKPSLQS